MSEILEKLSKNMDKMKVGEAVLLLIIALGVSEMFSSALSINKLFSIPIYLVVWVVGIYLYNKG
jgi:Na+/glutamate symporter